LKARLRPLYKYRSIYLSEVSDLRLRVAEYIISKKLEVPIRFHSDAIEFLIKGLTLEEIVRAMERGMRVDMNEYIRVAEREVEEMLDGGEGAGEANRD